MTKKIPRELEKKIDAMLERCGALEAMGNMAESDELAEEIWAILPEPKYQWDFYPQVIAFGMMRSHRDAGTPADAARWIERSRLAYGPDRDDTVELMVAMIQFDLGRHDEAMEEFSYQHKLLGGSIFVDEPDRYRQAFDTWRKARK